MDQRFPRPPPLFPGPVYLPVVDVLDFVLKKLSKGRLPSHKEALDVLARLQPDHFLSVIALQGDLHSYSFQNVIHTLQHDSPSLSAFTRSFRDKSVKRSPRRMDRLRRSFRDSFRKRKEHVPESSKPHQWQSDEIGVRNGTCSFHVKYLGCVEVFESRGMQVCEEALKVLRGNTRRRPVKAVLYVSGDGLRVVEDETKGLIVDQTIEKVSFCAPDRNHEKGFSYICRDGTTRRWMCHGFLALRESGERLSHAVGCAFAACLERKQRRDKECGVTMTFDSKNSTFTRSGSFRHTTLTERIQDPQELKPSVADLGVATIVDIDPLDTAPPPVKPAFNPYAIERPHATDIMLQRQGSFRGFSQLPGASPFKRQLSLRISELPSNLARQRSLSLEGNDPRAPTISKMQVSPIPEAVAVQDPVSAMCQQLSQGLSLLTSTSDFMEKSVPEATITNLNSFQTKLDALSFPPAITTVEPVVAPAVLPKPEQWLGNIVANTAPPAARLNPSPVPATRRTPPLAHLRALSLGSDSLFPSHHVNGTLSDSANSLGSNSSSGIGTTSGTVSLNSGTFAATATTAAVPPKDPFDAEWALGNNSAGASTNPFLPANTVKAFEVRL